MKKKGRCPFGIKGRVNIVRGGGGGSEGGRMDGVRVLGVLPVERGKLKR